MKRALNLILCLMLAVLWLAPSFSAAEEETVTLRICNWEEYIDQGDWGEDEVIDLESGEIFGEISTWTGPGEITGRMSSWMISNTGSDPSSAFGNGSYMASSGAR